MFEDANPVPHEELWDISHMKCTSVSNTVTWYSTLLKIVISPLMFEVASFFFPCKFTFVHVASFCFFTHQLIIFYGKKKLKDIVFLNFSKVHCFSFTDSNQKLEMKSSILWFKMTYQEHKWYCKSTRLSCIIGLFWYAKSFQAYFTMLINLTMHLYNLLRRK